MISDFRVPDNLARAIRRLGRMSLQPKRSRQTQAHHDEVIEAEINIAGSSRAGPIPKRSLKLHPSAELIAREIEGPPQIRLGQGHGRRILDGSRDGPASLRET